MAMQRNEVTEGAYFAQYIGCDPALQVFRNRGNQEPVRVQVVKWDNGDWKLVLPYLPNPSAHNPQALDAVFRDWRFLRRVRLSTRYRTLDRMGNEKKVAPSNPDDSSVQNALSEVEVGT